MDSLHARIIRCSQRIEHASVPPLLPLQLLVVNEALLEEFLLPATAQRDDGGATGGPPPSSFTAALDALHEHEPVVSPLLQMQAGWISLQHAAAGIATDSAAAAFAGGGGDHFTGRLRQLASRLATEPSDCATEAARRQL